MTPGSLLLNVTVHCERSALADVGYFLKRRLLPDWRSVWDEVSLLELPDGQGYALHLTHHDPLLLSDFDPGKDPDLLRIMQAYPGLVAYFPTLLKVLE